jgi:macrophage erythroblast attacher
MCSRDDVALKLWYRHQTDRLIVDFLVREGEYEKAADFSADSNLSDFEDVDLFFGKVKPVVDALNNGDCKEVSKWMHSNASKLKKLDSNLVARFELELRLQEFITMIQAGNSAEAIKYAQDTFLAYTEMGEYFGTRIKHAMSCLVFLGLKDSPLALEFTGPQRWSFLIREFHKLFFSLYGLSEDSLLSISVVSGLHAIITPTCVRHSHDELSNPSHNFDCPACARPSKDVLSLIPLPHRPTSSLVCPITRSPIDESNYPMALPNGQVYSKTAIEQFSTGSSFTDPRTGASFEVSSIRRVYIM